MKLLKMRLILSRTPNKQFHNLLYKEEGKGEGIERFDSNLELKLRPATPQSNHSLSIDNTSPPQKVYLRQFRHLVPEWRKY